MYFTPRRYDLAKVGRYKVNRKLGVEVPLDSDEASVLSQDDIAQMIHYLCALHAGEPTIKGSRGAWFELEIDKRDQVGVRLDRKRKQSVTVLLKALGWSESKILSEFGQYDSIRATLK